MENGALVIEKYEEIINGSRDFDKEHDNWTMFNAYQQDKK